MLSKFNQFPESFKGLIGLTCLTIIIFFTFLMLNIFSLFEQSFQIEKIPNPRVNKSN